MMTAYNAYETRGSADGSLLTQCDKTKGIRLLFLEDERLHASPKP
jgi:hypothetical protein